MNGLESALKNGSALCAPVFDRELALSRMGGDDELLREIAVLYLGDSDRMLQDIETAAAACDLSALGNAAHTFKGCVSNFGTGRLYDAALALERIGKGGESSALQTALQTLEEESVQLERELRTLIRSSPGPASSERRKLSR